MPLGSQLIIFFTSQHAWNRKADALVRRAENGRVDSYDFAFDVHERPAAVARIHRSIRLQVFLIRTAANIAAAAARFGADGAKRKSPVHSRGAAEPPHEVADFELGAVAPFGGEQVAKVDFQNGHV